MRYKKSCNYCSGEYLTSKYSQNYCNEFCDYMHNDELIPMMVHDELCWKSSLLEGPVHKAKTLLYDGPESNKVIIGYSLIK